MMKFSDLRYGQIFTIPVDPMNLWVKVPTIDTHENDAYAGGSPNVATYGMVNAILLTGGAKSDVFEMFMDMQDCQVVAIEFEEDEEATEPSLIADMGPEKEKIISSMMKEEEVITRDKETIENTINEWD